MIVPKLWAPAVSSRSPQASRFSKSVFSALRVCSLPSIDSDLCDFTGVRLNSEACRGSQAFPPSPPRCLSKASPPRYRRSPVERTQEAGNCWPPTRLSPSDLDDRDVPLLSDRGTTERFLSRICSSTARQPSRPEMQNPLGQLACLGGLADALRFPPGLLEPGISNSRSTISSGKNRDPQC